MLRKPYRQSPPRARRGIHAVAPARSLASRFHLLLMSKRQPSRGQPVDMARRQARALAARFRTTKS